MILVALPVSSPFGSGMFVGSTVGEREIRCRDIYDAILVFWHHELVIIFIIPIMDHIKNFRSLFVAVDEWATAEALSG